MFQEQQPWRLYHYWRSSSSWRLRWALSHKGLEYQPIAVNLLQQRQRSPEHNPYNPSELVPTLLTPIGAMSQSLAVLEWLEECYPNPALLPATPEARFKVRELSCIIACDTQPLQNFRVHKSLGEQGREFAAGWIAQGLKSYERQLASVSGRYSVGDDVSMADLCLVPQCYNAQRFNVDLAEYPKISAIYSTCLKLSSCQAAHPDRFHPSSD